jgi:hypothetical protein
MHDTNELTVAEDTGEGKLSAMANGAHSRILNHNALVANQQSLQRVDHSAERSLITLTIVDVHGIQEVVEGDKVLILVHVTGANTAQLLHVGTNSKKEA